MAGLFCQRALDIDANNLQALDMLGHISSELGNTQKAKEISFVHVVLLCECHQNNACVFSVKHCKAVSSFTESQVFLRAVELSPDVGHSKYMYLGQIHTGQEAVDYYTRGIQVLLSALEKQETMVSEHTIPWLLTDLQIFKLKWKKIHVQYCI